MGRSRRRHRIGGEGFTPEESGLEMLSPTYVPMPPPAWENDVEAPVLPLEGLEPWTPIRGPALALEDSEPDEQSVADSDDPAQLVLETPAVEHARRPSGDAVPADDDLATVLHGAAPAADLELELVGAASSVEEGETAEPEPVTAPVASGSEASLEVVAEVIEPDPIDLLYAEAREAAETGDATRAKTIYRQLLTTRPGHIRARNNLALLLDAGGDHAAALAELDRALDIEEENATLLTNRGALLGAMGRFAAAERDLKRVLRVEPAQAEALFNLGVVMTKKGLWAEAVPHLRRTIEIEPERGAAHFYLGEALNHVDDLHGAMTAYQRAAELQPQNPRALYGLGIVYDRLGRPDDAAQMYRRSREVGRR